MVELSVERGDLVLEIRGWSKLWALKKQLRVPLAEIRAVRRDPQAAKGWWKGWRMPGTHIPGVITAGTFYRRTGREFWDVRSGSKAVTIELDRGKYRRVVVDVADPESAIRRIAEARAEPPR